MDSRYWFEVAVILALTNVGSVVLTAFAEQETKARRLSKVAVGVVMGVGLSAWLGRGWFLTALGLVLVAMLVVHGWWLPRHGINGITAEPRARYRAWRGRER